METIDDIVREMREYEQRIRNSTDGCNHDVADNIATGVRDYANRIENAIEPTIIAAQAEVIVRDGVSLDTFNQVVMERSRLRDENARLKAALKPVLDVKWEYYIGSYCSGIVPCQSCECAVREAQGIYSEGTK